MKAKVPVQALQNAAYVQYFYFSDVIFRKRDHEERLLHRLLSVCQHKNLPRYVSSCNLLQCNFLCSAVNHCTSPTPACSLIPLISEVLEIAGVTSKEELCNRGKLRPQSAEDCFLTGTQIRYSTNTHTHAKNYCKFKHHYTLSCLSFAQQNVFFEQFHPTLSQT